MKKSLVTFFVFVFALALVSAGVVLTTIDTPEDNYFKFNSSLTDFNCSATTDSGTISNISRWDNSTGTWHRNQTVTFGLSTDAHGDPFTGEWLNETGASGARIIANDAITTDQFSWGIAYNTTVDTCYLTDASEVTLETAAIIGSRCTFDYDMVAGTTYLILTNETGSATMIRNITSGGVANIVGEMINWTSGWGSGGTSGGIRNIVNFSIDTSSTSASNVFTQNITGVNLWTCESCDTENDCDFASNRTINYINPQENFNSTSYETSLEDYIINLTSPYTFDSVSLIFNGTSYSTTKSGSLYSKTLGLSSSDVGNNSVYWNVTYSGKSYYTDNLNQSVHGISFGICNASLTNDFLNISFKDEQSLAYINASIPTSTFVYYLGDGTITKSYTYSTTNNNYNYSFCASPTDKTFYVDPYLQYKQGIDYPQRIWDVGVQTYTSAVTNKLLYLLNTVDGIYVTFQVINLAQQGINGVTVIGNRTIEGTQTEVSQGTTDSAGAITFWLNPDFSHLFKFIKTGYTTYTTTLTPTQSSYTITLGGGTTTIEDTRRGVNYTIQPSSDYLFNDTTYNFNFSISSTYADLEEYGFSLYYGNDTLIGSDSDTTTTGGTIEVNTIDSSNQTQIYMNYYYIINSTQVDGSRTWQIQSTDGRGFSLWFFFQDFTTYIDADLFGFDYFGKAILSFTILILVAGGLSYRYGLQSEGAIMGIIFGVVLFLDVGIGLIPNPTFGGLEPKENFVTIITGLILLGTLIREELR